MTVSSTSSATSSATNSQSTKDAFSALDMDEFIALMIAELQNQDPMDPMDNTQMLEQIGQIREIGSNDRLSESLDAVLLGQNMSTANSMIGQTIMAMDDSSTTFVGVVDHVAIEDGMPKLLVHETIDEHIDEETGDTVAEETVEHTVSLSNISQVLPNNEDTAVLAQRLATAGGLVGQTIIGLNEDSEIITGQVDQVAFEDGDVKLYVGSNAIDLENVTHVVAPDSAS